MVKFPLAHISWAVADNDQRHACDAFFMEVFGAETAYEMLMTPEAAAMGLDREERLLMVSDTMLIPIAAAGPGLSQGSPTGEMLRRSAGSMRWLGLALKVADLPGTAAWFEAKGFTLHYDRGMEAVYFLIGRKQAMGMRLEILAADLPNDPRQQTSWSPARWRDEHPLGFEGLQSIGVSAPSLEAARDLFKQRLELPELGAVERIGEPAEIWAFDLGDTVIEAMVPELADSPLGQHLREVQGIYCLTFKVKSAQAAADFLRGRGFELLGDTTTRFAIQPNQAHTRLIFFTEHEVPGYPPLGSRIGG